VKTDIARVYSFNCGASSAQLEKIAEIHAEEIGAQHHLAGGEAEGDRLARDLMAFIPVAASAAFRTLWTFTAAKP